jgi:hypothetical protein
MVKMLMIIHHIELCTSYIALVNCGHLLHIWVDHAEPKSKFQAEQVRGVIGGRQASSVMDANIAFGSRQAPVHPTKVIVFYI